MIFTQTGIELARSMHDLGLDWDPVVGHYVFDVTGGIEAPSPFQPGVYFMLDMNTFYDASATFRR